MLQLKPRSKILCCTKTKTHSHSWAGSPRAVLVYLSAGEISSLSHSSHTARPSWASSSASAGPWPQCKCSEPERKPSLVPGPKPYTHSLGLQITRDFLFLYLGPCRGRFVCVVYKKTQQKTTGFIWDTWPTITHKKNKSSSSSLCVSGGFLFHRACPALTWARTSCEAELPNPHVYVQICKW